MATPVFACGFECGVSGHQVFVNSPSISTTTLRSGLRAGRCNPTLNVQNFDNNALASSTRWVVRFYVRFATLPSADTVLFGLGSNASLGPCVRFKQSDSKIYAAVGSTLGASGVAISTNTWYRIDADLNINTGGNDTCDVRVDGTACGQATATGHSASQTEFQIGILEACTADAFFDDLLISHTGADYPLGAGYVLSYIPNADGTHNVAGANDFERSLTGTDITNSTTDAYQLIDDRPLPSSAVDFINGIAPPNATDYVEWQYEDSSESVAPRSVEAIIVHHDAGGAGTNNFTVTLREHAGGTSANIHSGTTNVGSTLTTKRAHFATVPGTSDAWTTTKFNALRSRFLVSDSSPDPYIDAAMLEAEFAEAGGPTAEIDAALKKLAASVNAEQRQTMTIDTDLVRVAASISAYMRPEVEIDSVVARVVAALTVQQQQLVTVGATLRPISASLNMQQEQRVTVDSDLVKTQALLNVSVTPDARIATTLVKTAASINVSQSQLVAVDSDLVRVAANLNAVLVPFATITATLANVEASLTDQQRQLVTIAATLGKVAASVTAQQRQLLTIAALLVKVAANFNVEAQGVAPEITVTSSLRKVQASLSTEQRQLMTIASTLIRLTASVNVSTLDARIAATLARTSASLTMEQRQLFTLAATLVKAAASLNAYMRPEVTIGATLEPVQSLINVEQQGVAPLVTLGSTLSRLRGSLSAEQRALIQIAAVLAEVAASVSMSQRQQVNLTATLRALTADIHAIELPEISVSTTLARVMAALEADIDSGGINATLVHLEASFRFLRILSRINLSGRRSAAVGGQGVSDGSLSLMGEPDGDLALSGRAESAIALEGRR